MEGLENFFSEVSVVVMLTLFISLIEALVILPAHLAHSKALVKIEKEPKTLISKAFKKLRDFNKIGDKLMKFMRIDFITLSQIFFEQPFSCNINVYCIFFPYDGSFGGGIIRTSFFPSIASDRISINLVMPNGTNERITDSIITMIEQTSKIVNKEFSEKYLKGTGKSLFVNSIKTLGMVLQELT